MLKDFKMQIFKAFLSSGSRSGNTSAVEKLLIEGKSITDTLTLINHTDEFSHTPLYLAVKRGRKGVFLQILKIYFKPLFIGHKNTALLLLNYGSNPEIQGRCEELITPQSSLLISIYPFKISPFFQRLEWLYSTYNCLLSWVR